MIIEKSGNLVVIYLRMHAISKTGNTYKVWLINKVTGHRNITVLYIFKKEPSCLPKYSFNI